MNVHETNEIRELSTTELEHVAGGFGALMAVTWMGDWFDIAKDAYIYAVSVSEDW